MLKRAKTLLPTQPGAGLSAEWEARCLDIALAGLLLMSPHAFDAAPKAWMGHAFDVLWRTHTPLI
jgi:hypothetical protein